MEDMEGRLTRPTTASLNSLWLLAQQLVAVASLP